MRTTKSAFIIEGINLAGNFATATTWGPKSHVVLVCQMQETFRSLFDTCKENVMTWLPKSVPKTPSEICLPKPAILDPNVSGLQAFPFANFWLARLTRQHTRVFAEFIWESNPTHISLWITH
jgi:hypothetical protein